MRIILSLLIISIGISEVHANSLVGHWVCSSVQFPTGLFLFRIFDFHPNGTFRSLDSMQERPPVRVTEGSWKASNNIITVKYKTWRIGSEHEVGSSSGYFGYRFIDSMESAFVTTIPWYQGGPVDFICGPSLDDIARRKLVDILERDIRNVKSSR